MVIVYNKVDNFFVVSADRETFLGFEMTANLRDTSPLTIVQRNRAEYRLILSRRGRRGQLANTGDIPHD